MLESVRVGKKYRLTKDCDTSYHYFAPGSVVKVVRKDADGFACLCVGISKIDYKKLYQTIHLSDLEEIPKDERGNK